MSDTVPLPPVPACPTGWQPTRWPRTGHLAQWVHRSDAGTITLTLHHGQTGPAVSLHGGPGLHIPRWRLPDIDSLAQIHTGIGAAGQWLAVCLNALADHPADDHEQPTLWETAS